jgi:hypothetical protein
MALMGCIIDELRDLIGAFCMFSHLVFFLNDRDDFSSLVTRGLWGPANIIFQSVRCHWLLVPVITEGAINSANRVT